MPGPRLEWPFVYKYIILNQLETSSQKVLFKYQDFRPSKIFISFCIALCVLRSSSTIILIRGSSSSLSVALDEEYVTSYTNRGTNYISIHSSHLNLSIYTYLILLSNSAIFIQGVATTL